MPGSRRAGPPRPLLLLGTVLAAASFGVIVYFAITTIAWFASVPTTDPRFGRLNHCLLLQVPKGRSGFAVAADGQRAAAFNGEGVAICGAPSPDGGRFVQLSGITDLTFDGAGTLWAATGPRNGESGGLWRIADDGPKRASQWAPVALSGTPSGVFALDLSGKLLAISPDGEVRAAVDAPRMPDAAQLVADSSGGHVALVGNGALWIFAADDLHQELGEAPCEVEFLWWLKEPGRALLECGPGAAWALELDAKTGAREAAPSRKRARSVLLPGLGAWVVGCESLPCEAPAP
jgi:hypothetical protein